jgi:hypothetical protein
MASFEIRYGELIDTYGHPAASKSVTFVPALIRLNGTMFSPGHYFDEHPAMPTDCIPDHADAAFVRARIPCIFGYTPTYHEEHEKSLLSDGFVAVLPDGKTSIPFECSDYYGRSSLTFSSDGPDESVQSQIADAFWEIVASEPDALDDFEQNVFHPGACVWIQYGCKNGEVYCDEKQ